MIPSESRDALTRQKCVPCEGGVAAYSPEDAQSQLKAIPHWYLTHEGKRIRRDWTVENFLAGMELFRQVAELAEQDNHHPDLHIQGYRNVWIELWTHAIDGLSKNDFILAAKIDQLPSAS